MGSESSQSRGLRYLLAAVCMAATALSCSPESDDASPVATEKPTGRFFTEITSESGLDFVHDTGASGELHMPEIMSGGGAMLDYDQDGDLDIYLTNGNGLLPEAARGGTTTNRLFRQDAGGRFVDATEGSGLGDTGYGMGVAVGDFDNDGALDVYASNYGSDRLFRNLGNGAFEDVTDAAGISVDGFSCSAAFCDFDHDGFLDIYVTQYVQFRAIRNCSDPSGRPDYCGPEAFPPLPDVLLHNNGDGTFTDVSALAGLSSVAAAGLGVVCDDLDDDGDADFYVANDAYANNLWINQGDGTFRDTAITTGTAYNLHGQPEAGMGVVAADLNGDSLLDLFVTHLTDETNTFYRSRGPGKGFLDSTGQAGLGTSSMAFTGFGVAAFDLELDGDLDLFVANGRVNRTDPRPDSSVPVPWSYYAEPNLLFSNQGTGRFDLLEDATVGSKIEISRSLAAGDVDNDGDVDVLVANVHGPARLYRNDAPRQGHWLSIRAVDPRLRRDAIGARVTVLCEERRYTRSIASASSYNSAGDLRAHFGLGGCSQVDGTEVRWPDGLLERFPGGGVDRAIELRRGDGDDAS